MDLMADLNRINQSDEAIRARRARRAARQSMLYDRLAVVLNKPSARGQTRFAAVLDEAGFSQTAARTAASSWNIFPEEEGMGTSLGEQHPGAAALVVVRQAFSEYHMPSRVDLRYHGMQRTSGHGAYAMDEGIVMVQAEFQSMAGAKHTVEVPVVVKDGRMLDPSILIHNGVKRIITQHTLDDIIKMGEFSQKVPDRVNMFAPPPGKDGTIKGRQVPIVNPGMYTVLPRRNLTSRLEIRAALRGVPVAPARPFTRREAAILTKLAMGEAPENVAYFEQLFKKPVKAWGPNEWKEFYRRYDPAQHKVIPAGPPGGQPQGLFQRMKSLFDVGPMDQDACPEEMGAQASRRVARDPYGEDEDWADTGDTGWGYVPQHEPAEPDWPDAGQMGGGSGGEWAPDYGPMPGHPDHLSETWGGPDMVPPIGSESPNISEEWEPVSLAHQFMREHPGFTWDEASMPIAWDYAEKHGLEIPDFLDALNSVEHEKSAPEPAPGGPVGPGGDEGGGAYDMMRQLHPLDDPEASKHAAPGQQKPHFPTLPQPDRPATPPPKKHFPTLAGRALTGHLTGRNAFYEPTVTGGPTGPLGRETPGAQDSFLDPAERHHADRLWPSATVRAKNEIEVRGRDGQRFRIGKGEVGEVVRDVDGTNRAYYVRWVDLGYACTVGRQNLRAT